MKKILCLVISLIVLLSSVSALAEEFTIHSGVMFGMSREEVIALENEAGFEVIEDEEYITVKGKIASIDDSAIRYYFEDGTLSTAWYKFQAEHGDTNIYRPENFYTVNDALAKKYGETSPFYPELVTIATEDEISRLREYLSIGVYTDYDIEGSNNWLIKIGESEYVAIDHFLMSGVLKGGGGISAGYHSLCYQLFSADEVETAIQNGATENQEDNQQLEEDI